MKKIAIAILSVFMLTLCACGNQPNNKEDASAGEASSESASVATAQEETKNETDNGASSDSKNGAFSDDFENSASGNGDNNTPEKTAPAQDAEGNNNNSATSSEEEITQGSDSFETPQVPVN